MTYGQLFQYIINLKQVPDYSTISLIATGLEKNIYYGIYAMFVELIDPETRLCAIDATALRSSKYDTEAKFCQGTRLDSYKGYKLHCITTITDNIIPLVFDLKTANVYDNQVPNLLYEAKTYTPFSILADAAYDDELWFDVSNNLELYLLSDIYMRYSKSIDSFSHVRYTNALFIESPIGLKLYKNRLKIEQLFSVLKRLYNLENPRLYGVVSGTLVSTSMFQI